VIAKIFYLILQEELAHKIQTFWKEFDDFQTARGPLYDVLSDALLAKKEAELEPRVAQALHRATHKGIWICCLQS
jgi:hypothetical protein